MNKVFIIGNLTNDPESRTTQAGINLCSFTVAVNRRQTAQAGQPEADFFRVTAWRQLGTICHQYLAKGRKVAVTGSVSANAYTARDGSAKASLEVQAEDVDFLTPKESVAETPVKTPVNKKETNGFVQVEPDEELPF